MGVKNFLVVVILVLVAFGVGYGLGYWKLQTAEKEWAEVKGQMQIKISGLEKDLAQAQAREKLRQISDTFDEIAAHLSEKNFGLAIKSLDGLKETFLAIQPYLEAEVRGKFDFLLSALEEAKKEAESLSPNAKKKVEEMKKLFDQALKPAKKG